MGLTQSTVSKHLKILEDTDLVESRKEGSWVNYKPIGHSENEYAVVLQKNLKNWLGDDPQIQETKSLVDKVDRLTICNTNEIGRIKNGKVIR